MLFDLTRQTNTWLNDGEALSAASLQAVDALYRELAGDVLGLLPAGFDAGGGTAELTDQLIGFLVEMRQQARKAKDFAQADQIRNRLTEMGVALEDGVDGTRWRVH